MKNDPEERLDLEKLDEEELRERLRKIRSGRKKITQGRKTKKSTRKPCKRKALDQSEWEEI